MNLKRACILKHCTFYCFCFLKNSLERWKWNESRDCQFISFPCLFPHVCLVILESPGLSHPLPGCQQGCPFRRCSGHRAQGLWSAVARSRGITHCRVTTVGSNNHIPHVVPSSRTHPYSPLLPLNLRPCYISLTQLHSAVKWASTLEMGSGFQVIHPPAKEQKFCLMWSYVMQASFSQEFFWVTGQFPFKAT